ncbi:MAG: carotenoid 1,2-hydratase [Deltaproteobacteria bacterium]|nr:MAG: carotenoid 1,2-hydratase [Deltaproteobacteria bacterium]
MSVAQNVQPHQRLGWLRWTVLASLVLSLLFGLALANARQGAETFRRALPGYVFQFPQDHAAHPEFRTEWWYYTGHLIAAKGRRFGFQLTFFRHALRPPAPERKSRWALNNLYFVHFAITDEEEGTFRFQEKVSRGALDTAGARSEQYHVWVEGWEARSQDNSHKLRAGKEDMGIDLTLVPTKTAVVHGKDGVSQKAVGEGYGSHYYSLTRMHARGKLQWRGSSLEVSGQAWMDHEFGSNQLREYQVGWDWFSVQLNDRTELMLYIIRQREGRADPSSSGTLVHPDGASEHLPLEKFKVETLSSWHSKKSGTTYPSGWRLRLPSKQLDVRLIPAVEDQELTTKKSTLVNYWEGSVRVTGNYRGKAISGLGYVELTGYDTAFRPDI